MNSDQTDRLHAPSKGNATSRFLCDDTGNFAITFALTAPILVLLTGMGVDFLNAYQNKTRMDAAADAAAVAAVSAAKAFFAANSSGALTGDALVAAAIAAGQQQGKNAFMANTGSANLKDLVLQQPIDMPKPKDGLTFTANVSWSAGVPSNFGGLVNISQFGIQGEASATSVLPKYQDFYIVTDVSGSMGIPADYDNQVKLQQNNPDNAGQIANGYIGGCQFACHFAGYQGYAYAKNNNIPLKLDSVGASLTALINTANSTKVIANQFRIGIYTFIDHAIQAAALSNDFTNANNVAGNLGTYLDQGNANQGMGSGGTHFENVWNDVKPYLQTAGSGATSTSPQPIMVLVTDGVDNNQTYSPWTGSQPQLPATTLCANAKSAGYTVAVLLITYAPIANPVPSFANGEDIKVNDMINAGTITKTMSDCASSGYFYQASSSDAINAAMQQIFFQFTAPTRLTQ